MSESPFPPASFRPLLTTIATHLKENNKTVSVAETATGGLISAALLSVPGASKIYRGGVTVYTLESRIAFADWTEENIKNYRYENHSFHFRCILTLRVIQWTNSGHCSRSSRKHQEKVRIDVRYWRIRDCRSHWGRH